MLVYNPNQVNLRRRSVKRGAGFVDALINKLPFELHLPGYQYCGPGTKVRQRIARGDQGVNELDRSCREHDIAYEKSSNLKDRHKADYELEQRAWNRVKSKDANLGEKFAAWLTTTTMKAKRKLGMGFRKKNKRYAKKSVLKKGKGVRTRRLRKRIIPIPKKGGFLPLLLPILGALGALGGGAAGIAKAVNDAKASKANLEEERRHNLAMEEAAKGKGLYLKPYKKGKGLYLAPYKKTANKATSSSSNKHRFEKVCQKARYPTFSGSIHER